MFSSAIDRVIWFAIFIHTTIACTRPCPVPRDVELRIEGWVTVDITCSSSFFDFIKQLGEAFNRVGVLEAIIPQTLQIGNDERIGVVGSQSISVFGLGRSIIIVWVHKGLGRGNGSAVANVTVPPAFIL